MLRVLALTSTDAARVLLSALRGAGDLIVEPVRDGQPLGSSHRPTVAIIEMGSDMIEASAACARVSALEPAAPQIALIYCTRVLNRWHLERLLRGELAGVVDLQASLSEIANALRSIARGKSLLLLQADREYMSWLCSTISERAWGTEVRLRDEDQQLLSLAAAGYSEEEIGVRIHLSPHTVHHKLERLRDMLGLRNRIELAAWAGGNGYYRSPEPLSLSEMPQRKGRGTQSGG